MNGGQGGLPGGLIWRAIGWGGGAVEWRGGETPIMWQNYKMYVLALIIYSVGTAALAMLELLAAQLGDSAVWARLATMLSGNFLGGFALVLGILRDDRVEKEKQRAEKELQRAAEALAAAQKRVEHERNRADRAEAELQRVRTEYNREMADRIRRLEDAVGIVPAGAADDDRGDRPAAA